MKIAFFGTPEFAVPVLEAIATSPNHKVLFAVSQPDRPAGRKKEILPTPVKQAALAHGIPVLQPEKVKEASFLEEYKKNKIDLNILVAFGQIVPDELIYHPKHHSINIHASLLPKYRGASPINAAIVNGDTETGVTYQFIEKRLDAGDIIHTEKIKISEEDDAVTMFHKLSKLSADSVLKVIDMIEKNSINRIKQDESKATFVSLLTKEDGKIDFTKNASSIFNQCRGLMPWPAVHAMLDGKSLKIYKCEPIHLVSKSQPGEIIEIVKGKGFMVKTGGESCLLVKEVQSEGGKRLGAYDFSLGQKELKGKILT